MSSRFSANSFSVKVSGPHTVSPVTRLLAPRSPWPCCTVFTCMSCQFLRKLQMIPPCRALSRYASFHPSHAQIAARCGGCDAAARHWVLAELGVPFIPTLPLDHGCFAAHSMHRWMSRVSRALLWHRYPGERPAPRESTRTHT